MYKADAMNRAKSTLAAVTGGLRVQRECVCVAGVVVVVAGKRVAE